MKQNKRFSVQTMVAVALMTAILCTIAPFSIPVGPVPISLATLGLYLAIMVLGGKKATLVCGLYILIGFVGLPVYSGFSGGPAKLLGPTGGFLVGYLLLTIISGFIVDKFPKNRWACAWGFFLGTSACYIIGTTWLAYQMELTFGAAAMIGVVPFLLGDVIKIAVAIWFGPQICARIKR